MDAAQHMALPSRRLPATVQKAGANVRSSALCVLPEHTKPLVLADRVMLILEEFLGGTVFDPVQCVRSSLRSISIDIIHSKILHRRSCI